MYIPLPKNIKSLLIFSFSLCVMTHAYANELDEESAISRIPVESYKVELPNAQWHVQASRLSCELKQNIPLYGEASFITEAGMLLSMTLKSERRLSFSGNASIIAKGSPWQRDWIKPKLLSQTKTQAGHLILELPFDIAASALKELNLGKTLQIKHDGWNKNSQIEIELSPAGFQAMYPNLVACLENLVPNNFKQLERNTFLFETNQYEPKSKDLDKIKQLAEYVLTDSSIKKIYIDGHSDKSGPAGVMLDYSRLRAESIQLLFLELGIPHEKIVMRYHGTRFPTASNETQEGKNLNRRVTVRLSQKEK
jgi:outer membrane protein OmpA-like peptidoglycan-associated protein